MFYNDVTPPCVGIGHQNVFDGLNDFFARKHMNIYANDKRRLTSKSQALIELILLGSSFAIIISPFVGGFV
jgi:hypothetical protein